MITVDLTVAWYDSSASVLWATIALMVITVVGVLIAFYTWRSGIVRRSVMCTLVSRSRLLDAPPFVRNQLEVNFRGESVRDPHVVALEISSAGRAAIPSQAFDKGRSLIFKIDAPIIKVLTVEHTPSSAPKPALSSERDTFALGPELLVEGEIINASILTEGRPTDV